MGNVALVIITALFSGTIATVITILWQKKNQTKQTKEKIFTVLMSKRYDIASEESVDALNMVEVVFCKSKIVRTAWKEFMEAVNMSDSRIRDTKIADKHLKLLEAMAKDIKYKEIEWEDIKNYYYPVALSTRKQDEIILRKIQIDKELAQINEVKKTSEIGAIATKK